ncbi:glycosyltransferase family 2 protein [Halalkalibacterium ligniniphilum]|uniref:glycosyltransferase family 2 protein n=1 Tax=Halalkalibacterium ligniniphilum TaxID=1134413 RepID=UPI00035FAAB6|nr:glycosyltransferase family 2 protein [Halalkalibacterium ligniniphilum]
MNSKKISIITPTYNSSQFIHITIKSIKKQTLDNWELIIVDDNSIDETYSILKSITQIDSRIKHILLNKNSGAAVARNTALKHAKGKYIAFLDSDDLWHPEKLKKQVEFMEKNNYAFTYTNYDIIDEHGNATGRIVRPPASMNYNDLLKNTSIGCLTVMLNKDILGEIEMPNIRAGQDTACWLSILKKGYTAYRLDEVLASYRTVRGSISSNKVKALKRTWRIYREVEKINLLKSSWYFSHYVYNAIKKRV